MSDRNKIAQALTVEQLDEFLEQLRDAPGEGRTLQAISDAAMSLRERLTDPRAKELLSKVSLMAAKSFRDTTFANYLKKVERRREFAERVSQLGADRTGATFADAAADNLAKAIFDFSEELEESEGPLDLKKASGAAFIISKIRQGDVARGNLQLKLEDYERRENERAEKKAELQKTITAATEKKGGLTPETLSEIEAQLAML